MNLPSYQRGTPHAYYPDSDARAVSLSLDPWDFNMVEDRPQKKLCTIWCRKNTQYPEANDH